MVILLFYFHKRSEYFFHHFHLNSSMNLVHCTFCRTAQWRGKVKRLHHRGAPGSRNKLNMTCVFCLIMYKGEQLSTKNNATIKCGLFLLNLQQFNSLKWDLFDMFNDSSWQCYPGAGQPVMDENLNTTLIYPSIVCSSVYSEFLCELWSSPYKVRTAPADHISKALDPHLTKIE